MNQRVATNTLSKFFAENPQDTATLETIFTNFGRNLQNDKQNRQWLSNKLTAMRKYGFVTRNYKNRDGTRVLGSLTLTAKGKDALGRENAVVYSNPLSVRSIENRIPQPSVQIEQEVTLETVYRDVKKLQRQLPSFEIIFEVKPKGVLY
jgi:hypothetical protein